MNDTARVSPYDTAIGSIDSLQYKGLHEQHALTTLRGKRQGWMDAEDKLLPLLRGLREMQDHLEQDAEHLATQEEIELLAQVDEVTGVA